MSGETRIRGGLPLALTALLASMMFGGAAVAVEEASYEVVLSEKPFQIREYAAQIVAETRVSGEMDKAGNAAFRPLFKYISGDNESAEEIAMTAPVTQREGEKIAMTAPVTQTAVDEEWRVSFMMPASFTLETIPRPTDPAVQIRAIPAQRMAVIQYSGTWSPKRYREHLLELQKWLEQKQVQATGEPVWARYNAPFVPWFMRRNEIMIPVAGG